MQGMTSTVARQMIGLVRPQCRGAILGIHPLKVGKEYLRAWEWTNAEAERSRNLTDMGQQCQ